MNADRLVAILMLMNQQETKDFIWLKERPNRNFLQTLCVDLGLNHTARRSIETRRKLEKYFDDLRNKGTDENMPFECIC